MAVQLTVADLLPFAPNIDPAQAVELINGTLARAAEYAPCILNVDFVSPVAAKDIIRMAVLRSYQSEGGIVAGVSVGSSSVSYDTSHSSRNNDASSLVAGLFTEAEISELQRMCRESGLTISPVPKYGMPEGPDEWPDPTQITWTVV